ncbi:protein kinase [Myxococcota bacterium]|nr:protein kinase [Myxococcota bacterium]MBU1511930.1 protein kinase [Myxococcota bacterium]
MEERDPLIGQTLGNYYVERLLGAGAMGQVFLGVHPKIDRKVAIKVLNANLSTRPDMSERFLAEARAVNHINHPNIVQVFDFGTLPDGRLYLIMEFLTGEDVGHYLESRGTLSIEETVSLVRQIASGLDAAHEAGIVHRDLKPDNVYIIHSKFGSTIKLLDFGIAKLLEPELRGGGRTATGLIMGTPAYMSPEQAMGRTAEIGPASDIYSLGVMVYQMVSGRLPFEADFVPQILVKHVTEPPTPITRYAPTFPEPVWHVLQTALAKDASSRHPTAGDFFQSFSEAAASVDHTISKKPFEVSLIPAPASGVATTGTSGQQVQALAIPSRRRWYVIASVVVVLLVAGLFVPKNSCTFRAGRAPDMQTTGAQNLPPAAPAGNNEVEKPAEPGRSLPMPETHEALTMEAQTSVVLHRVVIEAPAENIPVQLQVGVEKPFTVNTPFTYHVPHGATLVITSPHPSYRGVTRTLTAQSDLTVRLEPANLKPAPPMKKGTPVTAGTSVHDPSIPPPMIDPPTIPDPVIPEPVVRPMVPLPMTGEEDTIKVMF